MEFSWGDVMEWISLQINTYTNDLIFIYSCFKSFDSNCVILNQTISIPSIIIKNLEFIFYFEYHLVKDVLGVPWCTRRDPH